MAKLSDHDLLDRLDGARLSVEHGHLTIRTTKGWLLWETKIARDEALNSIGLDLETVLRAAAANKHEGS